MQQRALLSVLFLSLILGCKTTDHQQNSDVSSWGDSAEKESARQQFTQAIRDCVPLITAVVPGLKTIIIAGNNQREAVVRDFVNRLVQDPSAKTERSAELLKYYYSEKGRIFPPCGGEAAEYVLTEFAVHTNAIKVGFGEEELLKITE